MVGISDAISVLKYAWNGYWGVHVFDAVKTWLNGSAKITISDTLDEDMKLSENHWDEWTGTSPYDYKGNWSLYDLIVVAFKEANDELVDVYSSIDSWIPPEHVYLTIPRKDGSGGPRIDLMAPADTIGAMFGYIELALKCILTGGVVESLYTALLNIDPKMAGSNTFIYEDPANPGEYKAGSDCTPEQWVRLSDIATIYGLTMIIIKMKPFFKAIGRAGIAAFKWLVNLLFKAMKSANQWLRNKMARERLIKSIVSASGESFDDDFLSILTQLREIEKRLGVTLMI